MYHQHHPHDVVLYGKVIFSPVALLFPHVHSLTYRRIRVSSYIKMCRNDDGAVFFSPSIPLNGHLICLALEPNNERRRSSETRKVIEVTGVEEPPEPLRQQLFDVLRRYYWMKYGSNLFHSSIQPDRSPSSRAKRK